MAFLEDQTASTMQSVVDQIVDFAVANAGFTEPVSSPEVVDGNTSTATTTMRFILKGGMYYYFYGDTDPGNFGGAKTLGCLNCRMMKVLPDDTNYLLTGVDAQKYYSRMGTFDKTDGSYSGLNLYTDGDAVHVVLEVFADVYAHMSFGIIEKFGVWTGGEYVMSNSFLRDNSDNLTFKLEESLNSYYLDGGYMGATRPTLQWGMCAMYRIHPDSSITNTLADYPMFGAGTVSGTDNFVKSVSTIGVTPITGVLYDSSPNTTNLRSMLIPSYMLLSAISSTTNFNIGGHIPSLKYVNMERFSPKEITETNWIIYPYSSKFGDSAVAPISGNIGLAFDRS